MADRPMIFSAPMVRALLDGRKSQTRRLLKLPTRTGGRNGHALYERKDMGGWEPTTIGGGGSFTTARDGSRVPCPETVGIWHRTCGVCLDAPYQAGDRLWVRETWQLHSRASDVCSIAYRASINHSWTEAHEQFPDVLAGRMQPKPFQAGWASPIHMPRWASRLTLIVTDVRVQRLQDISEEDARAEGIETVKLCGVSGTSWKSYDPKHASHVAWGNPVQSYQTLWNSLHGLDAWAANPWIVAISSTVERRNIDAPRQEAP